MYRYSFFVVALCCLSLPAFAQSSFPTQQPTRLSPLPPQKVPFDSLGLYTTLLGESPANFGSPSDTLTDEQILRRLARIYRYQSNILSAQAEGNNERAEGLLSLAMTELGVLLPQPEIMERSRFRELYRSIITEYENYYGTTADTLVFQRNPIYQFRADIFAALNEIEEPLSKEENLPVLPSLGPVETQIPMTMNRLVRSSIAYLKRSPDKHLYRWLSRAETYLPMIERIFEEEGVPDELKYLAMIESGLVPHAKSWARAVGMWQFIAATGRAYDLQINGWVDERRDPEKATRAAARHLRDLYNQYNQDWHIAIAGYNCSPRCIKRGIRRAKAKGIASPTFWDIYPYIPRETRNYVPMFIATSLIASNPEAFGFDLSHVTPGAEYAFDLVPTQGMLSLEQVADLAGTDLTTIKNLNPQLIRGYLPPSKGIYYVRIPQGTSERFMEGYQALPEDARKPVSEYVVRRGDSLGKIGNKFGVSVSALKRANNMRGTLIRVGQRLIVPIPDYNAQAQPLNLADAKPKSVAYGKRIVRPIAVSETVAQQTASTAVASPPVRQANLSSTRTAAATPKKASSNASTRVVYRVRRGDTLSEIAQKYGVSTRQLRSWNAISGSRIRSGQRLYINAPAPGVQSNQASSSDSATRTVYKVKRGDTLSEIAERHGVRIADLRSWNNIRGSRIRVGQRLTVYANPSNVKGPVSYTVRRGDSLYVIARRHGVSVRDIKSWNNLRSNKIKPGQKLTIHAAR